MSLRLLNEKLYFALLLQSKALEFEVDSDLSTLKGRVKYFIGCRIYEVFIHIFLKSLN